MYIAIDTNAVVRKEDIIGIFDLDTSSQSYRTRESIKHWERNGEILYLGDDLPCSMVICHKKGQEKQDVWFSPLSSAILKKRWQSGQI